MLALGIDVGGSGIKGAVVDTFSGALTVERLRIATPDPSTPKKVAAVVGRMVRRFSWTGPVGLGMPGPVKSGRIMTANNLHPSWVGVDATALYGGAVGRPVTVVNDADAAGLAEMEFGAGRGRRGVVVVVTLGTGIGSALFLDGRLIPNMEFGQIELRGRNAELRASARVRKKKDLSWSRWGRAVDEYLRAVENITWPDLFIIGGGVSRRADRFLPFIAVRAPVVPALLRNDAGLIGAALAVVRP